MRHFINRLSKKVFGNAASRHGKAVPIIPVIEGGNGKRLHYHAVIDCPRNDLIGQFPTMIHETWLETPWGLRETDIQTYADAGWVTYISKLGSGLIGHSQKMTVAASATAEKKTVGQRS